jgi:soluble lytic murein transglycosylase
MAVESNFRHLAVSPDGARGIMQVKPVLARWLSGRSGGVYDGAQDLLNPEKNIHWGLRYLSWLQESFAQPEAVLHAYNVGHRRAREGQLRERKRHSLYVRRVLQEYAVTQIYFPHPGPEPAASDPVAE